MADAGPQDRLLALIRTIADVDLSDADADATLGAVGVDSLSAAEIAAAAAEAGVTIDASDLGSDTAVAELLRTARVGAPPSTRLPAGNGGLQTLARGAGGPVLRWWFDLRVRGTEHVPATGPVVLAMNHEGSLDIPIAVVASPRRITFMAKRELYKSAFVSWALNGLGGFRVDRDRYDLAAVDLAQLVLARGGALGMYPEGTRAAGRLLPFLPGAAWLALATGAPLVPCVLEGTERAADARVPRRVRIRVTFHPAVVADRVHDAARRRRRADEVTDLLRATIARQLSRGGEVPTARS